MELHRENKKATVVMSRTACQVGRLQSYLAQCRTKLKRRKRNIAVSSNIMFGHIFDQLQ